MIRDSFATSFTASSEWKKRRLVTHFAIVVQLSHLLDYRSDPSQGGSIVIFASENRCSQFNDDSLSILQFAPEFEMERLCSCCAEM